MLTLLAASLLSPPQEPTAAAPRLAPIFGFVRTDEHKPWVGARVHLLSRPLAADPASEAHEVHTESDARGNFRAQVRGGTVYTVWADSPPGAAPDRVSGTAEFCVAGRPVALTMREAPRAAAPIAVKGLDAWKARGPFTLRIVTLTHNVHVAPVVLKDGGFTPPAAPIGRQQLEAFDRAGIPLFDVRMSAKTTAVDVPPPAEIGLLVRAGFEGAGIAGARVLRRVGLRDYPVGTTDAKGRLRLSVPRGESPHGFRVVAQEFRRSFPGRVAGDAGSWICDMEPISSTHPVRVLLGENEPAAGLPIRAVVDVFRKTGQTSGASFQDLLVLATDARGQLEVDTSNRSLLHALAPAGFAPSGTPLDAPALMFLEDANPQADYRLDLFRPVRVAVRRADGSPAVGAELLIGRNPHPSPKVEHPSWFTDQRGEVLLLLPPSGRVGVLAMLDDQHGIYEVHVGAPGGARPIQRLELRLREPFWLRGEVVDAAGKPLQSSGVFASATDDGFLGGELAPAPEATTQGVRAAPFTDPKLLYPFVALSLSHRDRFRRRGPEFSYPVPAYPWRYFVNAFEVGGKRGKIVYVEVTGRNEERVRIEVEEHRR